ncbi:hypothetical protein HYW43_01910 [Candidatus Daviesbacteria bacterium]|nr:hypothetical protein [Candidatus Daviesbacteria bacterium]
MGLVDRVEFKYPKVFVEEYGAKAGLLLYVQEHLPQIPQIPMVVSQIGESPKDFLARADEAGIQYPRLFRSSAVIELSGYEGVFPTHHVRFYRSYHKEPPVFIEDGEYEILRSDDEIDQQLEGVVRKIATSPQRMENASQLPPEINVIAAEYADCLYKGVLLKHPNRPNFYLTTFAEAKDPRIKQTLTYIPRCGFAGFGAEHRRLISLTDQLANQLRKVIRWHDAIAGLPEMDPKWAYLIEYGLMPATLFQIHYFKPLQEADFTFDFHRGGPFMPIVMGVTSKEGEDYELAAYNTHTLTTKLPLMWNSDMRFHRRIKRTELHVGRRPQSVALSDCGGILAHEDVALLRQSKLALLYPQDLPLEFEHPGMVVNIVSNGVEVRITNKLSGEEIT